MKIRLPDYACFYHGTKEEYFGVSLSEDCRSEEGTLSFRLTDGALTVLATTYRTEARYIKLRWNAEMRTDVKLLGDTYERGYGDLSWQGIRPDRMMPWYMAASNGSDASADTNGRLTECFGVRVRPNAFCFWQYDTHGVTLWLDIRNGGSGTQLCGRMLECATILFSEYRDVSAYAALSDFCRQMSPEPYLPTHKVYGSNNWYYAYGNSSQEEILADTTLLADMCEGLENRPYMVIDDGWQPNAADAPWDRGNARFPDMRALADGMRARGVRPGIWVRYLINGYPVRGKNDGSRKMDLPEDWYLSRFSRVLDPSHPAVLDYVAKTTRRLTAEWGYELIKHDFSTYDIFGRWGSAMTDTVTADGWSFHDRTRTSAEILKEFYKTVKDNANGAVIIGCNCVGHLCAGLHQLNRTGDDTSGFAWSRTLKMGVNTLAFRAPQNGALFMTDADCVGITGAIEWERNREWLSALAHSGSPLFVSCKPGVLNEEQLSELREAYAVASRQADELIPLDWMENSFPERYLLNGKEIRFSWYPIDGARTLSDLLC